jgi:hypothetical protein
VIAKNRLRLSYITTGGFFLYLVPGFLPAAKQLSAATIYYIFRKSCMWAHPGLWIRQEAGEERYVLKNTFD